MLQLIRGKPYIHPATLSAKISAKVTSLMFKCFLVCRSIHVT